METNDCIISGVQSDEQSSTISPSQALWDCITREFNVSTKVSDALKHGMTTDISILLDALDINPHEKTNFADYWKNFRALPQSILVQPI
jgi:hypothetical protein